MTVMKTIRQIANAGMNGMKEELKEYQLQLEKERESVQNAIQSLESQSAQNTDQEQAPTRKEPFRFNRPRGLHQRLRNGIASSEPVDDNIMVLMDSDRLSRLFHQYADNLDVMDEDAFVQAMAEVGLPLVTSDVMDKYSSPYETIDQEQFANAVRGELADDDSYHQETVDRIFQQYANRKRFMSRKAVSKALRNVDVAHKDEEIRELVERCDFNNDGLTDEHEFLGCIKDKSDLEQTLGGLPLLTTIAHSLRRQGKGKSNSVKILADLNESKIRTAVENSTSTLVAVISKAVEELKMYKERGHKHGMQGKYKFDFEGGTLDEFNEGLAYRIGSPDLDVWVGMQREHLDGEISNDVFETENHLVKTTPRIEFNLAASGGTYYLDPDLKANRERYDGLSSEEKKFVNEGGQARRGRGPARQLRSVEKCQELDVVKAAGLSKEEIVAVVLYTGPMYKLWNESLRKAEGYFRTSIHVLASAMKKIQQSGYMLRPGMVLYRGLSGAKLPRRVFAPDPEHKNQTGISVFGVQSTTSDLKVALQYSGVSQGYTSTVIETTVGQVDSGAYISELSQYPGEREYVYPPGSYMQAEGPGRMEFTDHGLVHVIPMRINTNNRMLTVDEVMAERKTSIMRTCELVKREIVHELKSSELSDLALDRIVNISTVLIEDQDIMTDKEEALYVPILHSQSSKFSDSVVVQLMLKHWLPTWIDQKVTCHDDRWFHNDNNYKDLLGRVIDLKRKCLGAMKFFLDIPDSDRWHDYICEAFDHDLDEFEQAWMEHLKGRLEQLRLQRGDAISTSDELNEEIKKIASIICEREGYFIGCTTSGQLGLTPLMLEASRGNTAMIQLLIESGHNVDEQDSDTLMTALMFAAQSDRVSTLEMLVKIGGADPNLKDKEGRTALMYASVESVAVFLVQECGCDVHETDDNEMTALLHATKNLHSSVAEYLVRECEASTEINSTSGTCLSLALDHGSLSLVKFFVEECNADFASETSAVNRALESAAKNGLSTFVKYLLESCDIESINAADAFIRAIKSGQTQTLQYLLDSKPVECIEATDKNEKPSIVAAAALNRKTIVEILINHPKTDVDKPDSNGLTALIWAAREGFLEVVHLLLSQGKAKVDIQDNQDTTALIWAAINGHQSVVEALVRDYGASVNIRDDDGFTALMRAANSGYEQVANVLISEFGATIDAKTNHGISTLAIAAYTGLSSLVERLITEYNADVEARDDFGRTPVMLAACYGQKVPLETLAKVGRASLTAVDDTGWSVLMHASISNDRSIREWLLEKHMVEGIPSNDDEERMALVYACMKGKHNDVVKLMNRHPCRGPRIMRRKRNALAQYALVHASSIELVDYLIKSCGANAREKDEHGHGALIHAVLFSHNTVAKHLLEEYRCDVNSKDEDGRTPLIMSATAGNADMVRYLLASYANKVDVNQQGNNGTTALMMAARNDHFEVVKVLVEQGDADTSIENDKGHTAQTLAYGRVEDYLRTAGVKDQKLQTSGSDLGSEIDSFRADDYEDDDYDYDDDDFDGTSLSELMAEIKQLESFMEIGDGVYDKDDDDEEEKGSGHEEIEN